MADILSFSGWNNVSDRVPLGTLSEADNVDIDNENNIRRRVGSSQALALTAATAAYATDDQQHLYVVDNGDLVAVQPDFTTVTLASGMATGETYWAEVGGTVYFTGANQGVIGLTGYHDFGVDVPPAPSVSSPPGTLPPGRYQIRTVTEELDGRESACSSPTLLELDGTTSIRIDSTAGLTTHAYCTSTNGEVFYYVGLTPCVVNDVDQLSVPLEEAQLYGSRPNITGPVQYFEGRLWGCEYYPQGDMTVIWPSYPLWLELFDYQGTEYFTVPGEVVLFAHLRGGLVLGTKKEIYAYVDGNLDLLADYGAVDGKPFARTAERSILFWTERGICTAFPFKNLTEDRISVPPGDRCTTAVVEMGGFRKFLVYTNEDGTANNPY